MFEDKLKHYPDFPKEGIDFVDILPLLHDREAFGQAVTCLEGLCATPVVATVEARGFLFASPLLTVPGGKVRSIVPIRKQGKLPYAGDDLVRVDIEKEYGADEVFFRRSDLAASPRAADGTIELTLLDDLLATGGTAIGIARALDGMMVDGCRVRVAQFLFLVELTYLDGRGLLEGFAPVQSLCKVG